MSFFITIFSWYHNQKNNIKLNNKAKLFGVVTVKKFNGKSGIKAKAGKSLLLPIVLLRVK